MTRPGPPSRGVPPEAVARFTAAEARLYPLAVVDPAAYERGVTLTGMLLADLRDTCADVDAVLRRRSAMIRRLRDSTDEAGPGPVGLRPETLVDAASAVRCRELQKEQAARDVAAKVAAAREAGVEWLIEEPDPGSLFSGLYRRVELHVPTGTALVCTVEADGSGHAAAYRLEVVPPRDAGGPPPGEATETYEDQPSWARAIERRRDELSARP